MIVRTAFCAQFPHLAAHHFALTASPPGTPPPDPLPRSLPSSWPVLTQGLPPEGDPFAPGITPAARELFAQGGVRAMLAGAKTVAELDEASGQVLVRTTVLQRLFLVLFVKDPLKQTFQDFEAAQAQVTEAVVHTVQGLGSPLGNR